MLGFYVSPTAKVIRRRDLGLKSHPKDYYFEVNDKLDGFFGLVIMDHFLFLKKNFWHFLFSVVS